MATILWIEDEEKSVLNQIYKMETKHRVIMRSMPASIEAILKREQIDAVILDIMLDGVDNLSSIGKPQVETDFGYNAGFVLLDELIYSNEQWRSIPLLILSTRTFRETHKKKLENICSKHEITEQPVCIEKGSADWGKTLFSWIEENLK